MTTEHDRTAPDYGSFAEPGETDAGDAIERARSLDEFQVRDRDGDGGLTAEEYVGAAKGQQVSRRLADFMKADADGDGEITLSEWHKLRGTAHAGDELLELAELVRKVAPAAGDALRQVLATLPPEELTRVADGMDMAGAADATPEDRLALVVRALRTSLSAELDAHPAQAARLDGWLAQP